MPINPGFIVNSDDLATSYTTAVYPVGTRVFVNPADLVDWTGLTAAVVGGGGGEAIFVFNDEAATNFVRGDTIVRDTGDYATYDGILSAAATPKDHVLGVAQSTVEFGRWGWILRNGIGQCEGDGSVAAGDPVAVDTTGGGAVDTMFAGEEHQVIGAALTADTGTPPLFTIDLRLD
ncbi:MAG: hypothetical protein QME96_05570 [Myxococcota bacterium]|nr:hypothetical protein [Myxococcota bacterium]